MVKHESKKCTGSAFGIAKGGLCRRSQLRWGGRPPPWWGGRPLPLHGGFQCWQELLMHGGLTLQNRQQGGRERGQERGSGQRSDVYGSSPLSLHSIYVLQVLGRLSVQRRPMKINVCKACADLEIARTSSICGVPMQEIKAGWFMAFYCTSWPLLTFPSLRNDRSCNLDFYCVVCQPPPHPLPSLFLLSWVNLLWV